MTPDGVPAEKPLISGRCLYKDRVSSCLEHSVEEIMSADNAQSRAQMTGQDMLVSSRICASDFRCPSLAFLVNGSDGSGDRGFC